MKLQWTRKSQVLKQKKYLYLASYPKSGNTWFRSFMSALLYGSVQINALASHGILSSRHFIDKIHDIDTSLMTNEETKTKYAKAYAYNSSQINGLQIIKVHDAYHRDATGFPIIDKDSCFKCVYLVRNPLDVVASFANHSNISIEQSINQLCNKQGVLGSSNNRNSQLQVPQLMYDWSGHVLSWLDQSDVEIVLVRYEDMKKEGHLSFRRIVEQIGFECSHKHVDRAVELTHFDKLKKQEQEKGFKEKMASPNSFFRSGKTGGWKHELTTKQAWGIIEAHKEVMERLGYLEESVTYLKMQ